MAQVARVVLKRAEEGVTLKSLDNLAKELIEIRKQNLLSWEEKLKVINELL